MPLILPFFKFNPTDWLTSEKMAVMELHHIGAYINLLSHCWTTGHCTLPCDETVLKKLCKWDDRKHADWHLVSACFEPFRKTDRVTNARLYREWEEAKGRTDERRQSGIKGAEKRWMKPPVVRATRDRAADKAVCLVIDFETFWSAYPRKVGKKAALKAWHNARDKPLIVDILQAIDNAKRSEQWMKENGQFIPHPSTWINEGRWADQPITTPTGKQKPPPPPPKNDPIGRGLWSRTYGRPQDHGYE